MCFPGYKLSSGALPRICSSNSRWEPRNYPSCNRELSYIISQCFIMHNTAAVPGNCTTNELITAPENGEVFVTSHLYGGSAKYKCDGGGFTLMGDAVRNCTESGNSVRWSGSKPQCLLSELQLAIYVHNFESLFAFQLSRALKPLEETDEPSVSYAILLQSCVKTNCRRDTWRKFVE